MYFDDIMSLFILALVVALYSIVMPLVAFLSARNANQKLKDLQDEFNLLKDQLENEDRVSLRTPKVPPKEKIAASIITEPTRTKSVVDPSKEKKPVTVSKQQKAFQPTSLKGPTFITRMVANFKANWIIWLAGLSLALGGLFIVQYGMERGYLGPTARVVVALIFGFALIGAANYLRKKPNVEMDGWFSIPVVFAAGGIATLYGAVVSAHNLYHLTNQSVGFASMVFVSFIAIGAGLTYGPVLAVIGILGAFISPFLISAGESDPIMYLYFLSVLISALVVEKMRRWIWLSTLAVLFTLITGTLLNLALPDQPYFAFYIVVVILAVTSIPAFGMKPKWGKVEMVDINALRSISTHYPTVLAVITTLVSTILLCFVSSDSLVLWQVSSLTFLALTAWAIFWCNKAQNLDQLALIFMGGLLYSVTIAPLRMDLLIEYNSPRFMGSYFDFMSIISVIAAILFLVAAFWRSVQSCRPVYWVASGSVIPVLTYFFMYARWHQDSIINERVWVFFAIFLAAILAVSAILMLRSPIRQRRLASDFFSASTLVTLSFLAYLTIDPNYLAHIAALLSLAALALVIRFKFRWTGYLIWAFVTACTTLVVFKLFPVYSLQEPVLLVIFVFGVVAALLLSGYMMAKHANLPNRVILYETATLLTIALLVCSLIARIASGGEWSTGYMSLGLYATVWFMMAGVQFKRMSIKDKLTNIRRYLGYGYSFIALGSLGIAILMSPLTGGYIKGILPLDTVMVAYALPAFVVYGLYHLNLLPNFITRKIIYGFVGAITSFIMIMEIRRFWHGNSIPFYKGVSVGELYSYTIIMLVATATIVMLAIYRKDPNLRKIGLALAALTAAKVFFWDTAGMQGLARASVFIALGLTLAGIGWLLQMSQSNDKEENTSPKDT